MWRSHVRFAKISVCLLVLIGLTSAPRTVFSQSTLVSQWTHDEGGGKKTNDAVTGGNGSLENGATWTAGQSGAAVTMDGIDDHISIPWVNTSGSAITLSAWVKNSSFASGVDQSFISKA